MSEQVTRTVTDRVVVLSRRELFAVLNLTDANQAVRVAIREQRIDGSDAYAGGRDARVRSYVVTLYGAADPTSDMNNPVPADGPLQFLLISGPAIEGSIDVVSLTRRQEEAP